MSSGAPSKNVVGLRPVEALVVALGQRLERRFAVGVDDQVTGWRVIDFEARLVDVEVEEHFAEVRFAPNSVVRVYDDLVEATYVEDTVVRVEHHVGGITFTQLD